MPHAALDSPCRRKRLNLARRHCGCLCSVFTCACGRACTTSQLGACAQTPHFAPPRLRPPSRRCPAALRRTTLVEFVATCTDLRAGVSRPQWALRAPRQVRTCIRLPLANRIALPSRTLPAPQSLTNASRLGHVRAAFLETPVPAEPAGLPPLPRRCAGAAQPPQAVHLASPAPSVDHHREPCPDRILDDIGGAFSMGAIGGGMFHAGKQMIWGPKAYKMRSAFEVRVQTSGAYVLCVHCSCRAHVPARARTRIGAAARGYLGFGNTSGMSYRPQRFRCGSCCLSVLATCSPDR